MPMKTAKRRMIELVDPERCHTCQQAAQRKLRALEQVTPDYALVYRFCSRMHRDLFVHYGGRHVRALGR